MATLRFGDFEINLDLHTLSRGDENIEIGAKPLRVLIYLIENRHRVVSREDLRERVWKVESLSDSTIPTAVMSIRKALGEAPDTPRFISSNRGRGYRFVGKIRSSADLSARRREESTSELPFVGRESQIREIQDTLRCVRSLTEGRLVIVTAEGGAGKTRLLSELVRRLGDEVHVASTHAPPRHGAPSLWPWRRLIESAIRFEEDSVRAERIRGLLRKAQEGLDEYESMIDLRSSRTARFRMFQRWSKAISAAVDSGSSVILLDDIHRFDLDSLNLLYWIADELHRNPILVVATSRPCTQRDETSAACGAAIDEIRDLPHATELILAPFSTPEIERFLNPLVQDVQDLSRRLLECTAGNAFLLVHALQSLEAVSDLDSALDQNGLEDLPFNAREIAARRLADLPEGSQALLQTAAVLGEEFDSDALATVSDLPHAEALGRLVPAVEARLLGETGNRYRFRHALLREALCRAVDPAERMRLHVAYAQHKPTQPTSSPSSTAATRSPESAIPLRPATTR